MMAKTATSESDSKSSGWGRHPSKWWPKRWMFNALDAMALLGGARYRWEELPAIMADYRKTMKVWTELHKEAQDEADKKKEEGHN